MGTRTKLKGLVVNQQHVRNRPQSSKNLEQHQRWVPLAFWGALIVAGCSGATAVMTPAASAQPTPVAGVLAANRQINDSPAILAQATAVQLQSWTYNPVLGRLELNIRGQTQPRLFTLDNPSRIVVDLPNVKWGRPEERKTYSGRVQSVRVSQFSPTITRLVLDIDPSQPIAQRETQLLSPSPNKWAVQLLIPPQFGLTQTTSDPTPTPPTPTPPTPATAPTPSTPLTLPERSPATTVRTHILGIEPLEEGFLVRTNGPVNISTRRVFNPHRVAVDFFNTDVSQMNGPKELAVNRFGVSMLRAGQFQPTVARIALDVERTSGTWEGRYDSARGGVILTPAGSTTVPISTSNTDSSSATRTSGSTSTASTTSTTIQSVQVQGNRLVISANGFMFYRSKWDESSKTYQISVSPARLPESMADPGLVANGPIERVRFAQENSNTVSILVEPTSGVEVREPNSGQGSRRITLEFLGGSTATAPAPTPRPAPVFPPPAAPASSASSNGIVVAIDPGHGGRDPGALGVGGIREKELTLSLGIRVQQLLQQQGFKVVMTRMDDREILLQPRIDRAVAGGASILVSIHGNALNRSNISGVETYYLRPDSARLAQVMHRSIIAGTGAVDRNIRRARFYMVRETPTTMPSVLLETGYLTNPTEAQRLRSAEYRERLAQAIARGIAAYFGR